jgi:hypothetical protein
MSNFQINSTCYGVLLAKECGMQPKKVFKLLDLNKLIARLKEH